MNEKTDVNIITKQIVINGHMSSHLLPITADEKIIDLIQSKLDKYEQLQKDINRYMYLKTHYSKNEDEYQNLHSKLSKVGVKIE